MTNLPPSASFTPQAGVTATHAGFVAVAPHSALQLSVNPTLPPLSATATATAAAAAAATAAFGNVSTVAGSSGTGAAAGGGGGGTAGATGGGGGWGGLNTAYRFATNNSGLENLGNGYDVEVPSHMDDPDGATAAATNSATATGAARAAAAFASQPSIVGRSTFVPSATLSAGSASNAYAAASATAASAVHPIANPSDAAANGGWFNGWRIEYAMNSNEHTAMKHILAGNALPPGTASAPPAAWNLVDSRTGFGVLLDLSGFDTYALIKKLFVGCTSVAAHADRFHAAAQEVAMLKQRNAQLEAAVIAARANPLTLSASSGGNASTELALARAENHDLRQRDAKHQAVVKHIREQLICPICTEVAVLPKVLGVCGHIACQNCLKTLDDVAFATLTANVGGASARQHLMARRCPQCRAEIIGAAFPILPLKEVAIALVSSGLIEVDLTSFPAGAATDWKSVQYDKETVEGRHVAALQLGCYAQSQLAQHCVSGVIASVTRIQWIVGVYILFESAVSRVFFETFATTLHGKAGGVNVLVNASQRMLAVQLIEKKGEPKTVIPKADSNHLLIKVATDGRFTLQVTPDLKPNTATAGTAAAATAVPIAGSSTSAGTAAAGGGGGGFTATNPTVSGAAASSAAAAAAAATLASAASAANSGSGMQSIQSGAGSRVHPADGYAPLGGSSVGAGAPRQQPQQPATAATAAAAAAAKPPTGPQAKPHTR